MGLRAQLVLGLCFITLVAMLAAAALSVVGSYRTAQLEVRATLDRAAFMLERSYRGELPDGHIYAARVALEIVPVMAPGTCIEYHAPGISRRRLCAGWQGFGSIPPAWFRNGLKRLLGPLATIDTAGISSGGSDYAVEAGFDPVAAATRAWQQVRLAVGQAATTAAGILIFGTVLILHSLRAVPAILDTLGRLAAGDLGARLKPTGGREFRRIGQAVDHLGDELERAAADRVALTRKLLEVEDDERRQLARDLHDEFGQTLTATAALAAAIEVDADDPRIASDARAITRNVRRMMETLRGAFARLRPPDLEEVGLEASLRAMFAGWGVSRAGTTRFRLACPQDVAAVPPHTALNIYRIVQECVTNAVRHGRPSLVAAELCASTRAGGGHVLTVEDDGGGSVKAIEARAGHGVLGIRERVAAMGGTFAAEDTRSGIRVVVSIPAAAVAA